MCYSIQQNSVDYDCKDRRTKNRDKSADDKPWQVTKTVLNYLENQDVFKFQPEFSTFLRQIKPSYDKYVVKEVKTMKGLQRTESIM